MIPKYGHSNFRTLEEVKKSGNSTPIKAKKAKPPKKRPSKTRGEDFEQPSLYWALSGYISYIFLFVVNWFRELIYGMGPWRGKRKQIESALAIKNAGRVHTIFWSGCRVTRVGFCGQTMHKSGFLL